MYGIHDMVEDEVQDDCDGSATWINLWLVRVSDETYATFVSMETVAREWTR